VYFNEMTDYDILIESSSLDTYIILETKIHQDNKKTLCSKTDWLTGLELNPKIYQIKNYNFLSRIEELLLESDAYNFFNS
jgi:hypothetical protein